MLNYKMMKYYNYNILLFLLLFDTVMAVGTIRSKRGLIVINSPTDQTDIPVYLSSPMLSWAYNYSPQPSGISHIGYPYGNLSFIPMLWGANGPNTFFSTLKTGPLYKYVLGFNEPDMSNSVGGSALSVAEAVSLWQTEIQPLKNLGYMLGSPAGRITPLTRLIDTHLVVASTDYGADWLASFFSLCQNCTIDFIAAHFYGTSSALESYLCELHANYSSIPIWLTEFGFPQSSTTDVISSLNQTITFLDNAPWIQRYAYFGTFRQGDGNSFIGQSGAVLDGNGDITAVGKIWLGMSEIPNIHGLSFNSRK